MHNIKCPICNKENYKVIYKSNLDSKESKKGRTKEFIYAPEIRKIGQMVKCKGCGLIYINPQEECIEKLYKEIKDKNYELSRESRRIAFERNIRNIEEIKRRGKILDVGCSTGIFLEVAKKKDWNVYGIELSKWGYERSKEITPHVYNKIINKCNFKENFFDVITMWDLIEHSINPNREIKEANKILKKDGLLVIIAPNIDCLFSKITGRNWWGILRMHLFYFSPKTITKLLEKNNFKIIKIKTYSKMITLKYAIDWFRPYKKIYKILKIIRNSKLGNLKIKVNPLEMIVYAKKK